MNKTTLKTVRLLAPGAIALVCILPYVKLRDLKTVSDAFSGEVFVLLVILSSIIIGGIYYSLDVRGLLWKGFVHKCHENVRSKMIKPYSSDPAMNTAINRLTDKKVMRIFYYVVDNDPSLSDQAHDVRLNGAVLTTIIDAIFVLMLFAVVYIITYFLTCLVLFALLSGVAVLLQPLLWLLKKRVSKKHIELEDEQLEVINQLHSTIVREKLQDVN